MEHRHEQSVLKQPSITEDSAAWTEYWQKKGQLWRTEPEIDRNRQVFLAMRLATIPDVAQGTYPFKGVKLSRADIEWLLATYEDNRGFVDHKDESQRKRIGLDLRGADLRQLNLAGLPLAHMRGGLNRKERTELATTLEQWEMASVHLEGATLFETHLEGADLFHAHLEGANLYRAHLEGTYFKEAHLEGTILIRAHLEGAWLIKTHLEKANFREAHLEGSSLREAHLEGAILHEAFFDSATNLRNVALGNEKVGFALLADVRWGGANLAVVKWSQIKVLGDEYIARQKRSSTAELKEKKVRLEEYQAAVRANRQLSLIHI